MRVIGLSIVSLINFTPHRWYFTIFVEADTFLCYTVVKNASRAGNDLHTFSKNVTHYETFLLRGQSAVGAAEIVPSADGLRTGDV